MALEKESDNLIVKEFARRLYILRVSRSMTRSELSRKTGINIRTIADAESGYRFLSLRRCIKIADALNVRVSYLFDFQTAPRIISVYPTLREVIKMASKWVDNNPAVADLPVDLLKALRSKERQDEIRRLLKLELVLPEKHRDFLEGLESAQVATFPPVDDPSWRTGPLG